MEPRLFSVIREHDSGGVSGTGRVLDGVLWHNGKVAVCWRSDESSSHGYSSVALYESWEAFNHIHIASHPENKTEIRWHDELQET